MRGRSFDYERRETRPAAGGVTEALAIARTLGPQHVYSLAGVGRVPTTCVARCALAVTVALRALRSLCVKKASP